MAATVGSVPRKPTLVSEQPTPPTVQTRGANPVTNKTPAPNGATYQKVAQAHAPRAARPATTAKATPAENFMQPLDHGLWQTLTEKQQKQAETQKNVRNNKGLVNGYLDFAVQNFEYHKSMSIKLLVTRENGVVEEFLYRPHYKGHLPDGRERWGTDAIELFPEKGPHGKIKHVDVSFAVHVDEHREGRRHMVHSSSTYRLCDYVDLKDLAEAKSQLGPLEPSGTNKLFGAPVDAARSAASSRLSFKDGVPPVEVHFSPYGHPERAVIAEIDNVIKAKEADPQGRHYIHASVFDINDSRIVDKLLEAHARGVEIKLLTDASHLDPNKKWEDQYRRLQQAGVEVVGVQREGFAASNHTKFAIYDGKVVTTGSYNWETRAANENSENMVVIRSPEAAAAYDDLFEAVGGGVMAPARNDPASKLQVFYSQRDNVAKVIYDQLQSAKKSITISMFTLRNLHFEDGGRRKDVLDALIAAKQRGVDVKIILEKSIADEGEYYGRKTPDDPTDEMLAEHGIEIVKVKTNFNNNPYAAMHHKFCVIDEETVLTGAYNWYIGSTVSDDDLLLVKDTGVARSFLGEFTNLRMHYDPEFDHASVPSVPVQFKVNHPHTRPGDTVFVVGDIPELGGWDLQKALPLDASSFPDWKLSVDVPAGTHFSYKFFVKRPGMASPFWEGGENREHTANPNTERDEVREWYR